MVEDYSVLLFKNPRILIDKDGKLIIGLLQQIAVDSFGVELGMDKDAIRENAIDVDYLCISCSPEGIIGFASGIVYQKFQLFYLQGIAIRQGFHGKGIGSVLIQVLLSQVKMSKIGFTTQNPIMFCLVRRLLPMIYPSPEQRLVPDGLRSIGIELLNQYNRVFHSSVFVVESLYTNYLYPTIPRSNNPVVDNWFKESLQIENEKTRNAFLFIAEKPG